MKLKCKKCNKELILNSQYDIMQIVIHAASHGMSIDKEQAKKLLETLNFEILDEAQNEKTDISS
ncbi:MAG: hypothetical protein QW046_05150 [Candidatus Micrarchaeaceae archaeon]